ncbi:MAG TPA: ammonium transporter [Vicinamibacterales bacterium]|nr:ammonium transporter [Vicinamibacterales bacterium]
MKLGKRQKYCSALMLVAWFMLSDSAHAKTAEELTVAVDTIWVVLTASLVFFMNLGFALVESGFCRAKNTVNILSKNFIVFAISCLAFYLFGWGLMFGNGSGVLGSEGLFALSGADNSPVTGDAYMGAYKSIAWTGVPLYAKFFFQLVFAGTAATIVSGSVAERTKYLSFIVFSFLLVAFVYPVTGHWIWGGGWLATAGFWDFAGSTVVHSVGGWAALAGIIVLGPRLGKYGADGKVHPIPAHSMTSGVIGCFVLWLGWFGFNPGSTMAADGNAIAHIFMTTNTAAFMGLLSATALNWLWDSKPDLGMSINGCLAGLVAITAPCAFVTVNSALIIGLLSGLIVVCAVKLLDAMKLDDPVGAVPVHLFNGVFGTICVGLFAVDKITGAATGNGLFNGGGATLLIAQLKGIGAVAVYTLVASLVFWYVIKAVLGLRVSKEEEEGGLDIGEHGQVAYTGFSNTGFGN